MKKAVKIAIDISPTQNENAKRGVGFYTSRLTKALQKELKSNPDYKNWQIDFLTNPATKKYDLIHYPYFDPFFSTLPKRGDTPTIVTVHDLIPIRYKKHYPVGLKGNLRWLIQKHNLKKTDLLITDSHFSKYEIYDLTGYPVDRIYTIHLAPDSVFKLINKSLTQIKKKYNLPDKFVFYVGDINWNKNIPNLVKTCQKLKYPLVIAGSTATQKNVVDHPWNKDLLWLQKQTKATSDAPTLLGFVPAKDLVGIYNLATLYCQPSFCEGFGLPLLEAMASGCPTVYAHASSLIEVSDYSGQYFHPLKKDSLKNALRKVWTNPSLQKDLSKKGIERSSQFSWRLTALQTLAVYELLV